MRWKAQSRGSTRAQRRVLGSGRPLRRAEPSFPGLFPSASCSWSSLCSPGRSLPLSQKRRLLLDSTGQPGHRRLFPLFLLRPEHLPQPCHPAESLRQSPEAVSRVWGTTDRARPSWPPRPTPSGLPHSARAGAPSLGCSRRSSFCRSGSRQRRLLWGQAGPCGRASRLPREEPCPQAALLPLREATLRAVPGWLPAPFARVTMCSSTPSVRPVPGRRLHSSVPGPLLGLASPTPQVYALLVCAFLLRPPAGRRERGRRGQDSASSSAASLAQRPSPGQGLPGTFRKADQSLKSSDSSDKALRTREASLEHGTQLWGLPHAGLPGPSFLSLTAVTWRRNPLSRSVAASLSATHSFLEVVAK